MTNKIPMSSPDLTDLERQAVQAVLNTPTLSMGHWVADFEKAFRDMSGLKHAVAVSSGTAGLHLCVRAANIGAEDLVLTAPFSFVASANVLLYENAVPVFVDVDSRTGNMDPQLTAEAVRDLCEGGVRAERWLPRRGAGSKRTLKGMLPIDVFGQPADLDPLRKLADDNQLVMIEDACEALGASYKGRPVGTAGDYAAYAFYPNKQITTGEGGVVVTNNEHAADMMRALRNQGRAPGDTWLQHTYLGYNYRLDEMSAALGVTQMGRLEELLQKRDRVARWYSERLAEIPGIEVPVVEPFTTRMSWFVYVVRFDPRVNRDQLAKRLEARGIAVRPYFLPIHLQPYMRERFGYREGDFPVTEDLGRRGLAVPFSGVMTEEQVEDVCADLRAEVLRP
ncbi:MAG TPA: DegT/DnrJ/EryC1/StrS family aminotransferase [Anaerolineales bacterium]|nr:DegT/DnrJ/EryC1/StrS family aminotransferase [Anaerolineales bacterium]